MSKDKEGKPEKTSGTMRLYVGNLSLTTSSEDLQQLFSQAGTVESASVVEDRETGRSRGFGFVEMATKEEGEAAIAHFNEGTSGGDLLTTARRVRMSRKRGGVQYSQPRNTPSIKYEIINVESAPVEVVEQAINRCLENVELARQRMANDQIEIDRLRLETRALISEMLP